ncbi:HAD family hydrolase [Crateriforma conspicua]|uniref:Alpha-D-glucose-1-phosphate phosphatase YihX n=1 Tax=Crateriforma conspicua TaxID=2527996 RepID=A0A5C6FX49_9PLAN|nr:HAD family phosphatase [Crateriforma conspicua]TWU65603.1 Alpha-D-glucose-1-phosphate phosphatase YihX [Crateriforma conspicua]
MNSSDIRIVYFDLGNILCAFDRSLASFNLAELLSVDLAAADDVLHGADLQERFEHGEITGAQYAEEVCRRCGRPDWLSQAKGGDQAGVAAVLDAVSDMFTAVDGMDQVVVQTRDRVGRVGMLSNTCEAHWDWINRQAYSFLDSGFDPIVLSCRVASMKPDAAIYQAAESMADCGPSSIFFVDDKPENVEAARQRGWVAEVAMGLNQVRDALTRHQLIG